MSTRAVKALGIAKGTGSLVKARFGAGMLLQHEDLDTLAAYTQNLNRLMFRTLFGCGVMCGLVVTTDEDKCGRLQIRVSKGVALDCCGDPIEVAEEQLIAVNEDCEDSTPGELWVVLCAKTKSCAPRASMCPTGDDEESPAVCTRERYAWEIRVLEDQPKCACGCDDRKLLNSACQCVNPSDPCYKAHYNGECDCDCGGDCILLARVDQDKKDKTVWNVSHNVRRFIRPVLMQDPLARVELADKNEPMPAPDPDQSLAMVREEALIRRTRKRAAPKDAT